jgi:hypothetical protein
MQARACRTLFPQPIGQLDAALAAQYRLPAIYSNSIGPFDRYVLKDTGRYITILLDPGGFLNRLGADLILIPPRGNIMTAASIDCGKKCKGDGIERD